MKKCNDCHFTKSLTEFYLCRRVRKSGTVGYRYKNYCRDCAVARNASRRGVEKYLVRHREYMSERKEYVRDYNKRVRNTPKGRAIHSEAERRRRDKIERTTCPEELRKIRDVYTKARELDKLARVCPVFSLPELSNTNLKNIFHVDHIIPLCRGGKHEASNLQIILAVHNLKKGRNL